MADEWVEGTSGTADASASPEAAAEPTPLVTPLVENVVTEPTPEPIPAPAPAPAAASTVAVRRRSPLRIVALGLAVLALLASLVPMFYAAQFARPGMDDFMYSAWTHQAIEAGGGFFSAVWAALRRDWFFFNNWQGLYTAAFLLAMQPGVWGVLLMLLLLVFSAAFTVKKVNIPAFLPLILLFFAFSMTMDFFEGKTLIQVGCYAGMLLLLAVMGRILLPRFCTIEEGVTQLDAPLATGVLTVFGAVSAIDWYPRILASVFLALYSLLYLGRVKRHYIPAFLASFFGCTAVLFHDIDDPFGILEVFRRTDMITPQILLYLLPVHLFIFTLLFILPKTQRRRVHAARFIAYCVTMLCLLASSFRFGNVADAIVLVVFSFAILVGSFFVRRLRWFTLGFAVLVVMTLRLTWSFWTSLHWGIYLFLAGILLIGIASFFEYRNRRRAEHPEEAEAEKKPVLFKDWQW